jgi:hypothetical protein
MSTNPNPIPASGPDLLASLAVGVRLMDSHGIAPWSLQINRGERKVEASIARDELDRLVPHVDGARVVVNGMFVHLNGSVDGVPVEFYANAEDADLIGASLDRQNLRLMRRTRTVTTTRTTTRKAAQS